MFFGAKGFNFYIQLLHLDLGEPINMVFDGCLVLFGNLDFCMFHVLSLILCPFPWKAQHTYNSFFAAVDGENLSNFRQLPFNQNKQTSPTVDAYPGVFVCKTFHDFDSC